MSYSAKNRQKRTAGVPPGIGLCLCPGVRLAVWDNTGNRVDPVPAASLCSVEGFLGLLGLLAEIHYLSHSSCLLNCCLQNGPRESPLRKGWDESGARLLAIQPMETGGPNGPTVSFASCPRYATKQMFYFLVKMLDIFQLQHIIYTWKRDISIATPVCP